jgi:hypothetical protein
MKSAPAIQEASIGKSAAFRGEFVTNLGIQIQRWPADRLVPSSANSRTHSPEQVEQITNSIREFGFVNPILVAADGEIIAGEARLWAALRQGMRDVPVIVLKHLFTTILAYKMVATKGLCLTGSRELMSIRRCWQ